MQRYFLNTTPTNKQVDLPDEVAHHLVTVLRATVGTEVELVMGNHKAYLAKLVATAPQAKVQIIKQLD